jgi:PAS domain S-box-containing protein
MVAMSGSTAVSGTVQDLDGCAREPIHLPGTIQPYGVLLVVDDATWVVTHASANTCGVLGLSPDLDPVGQPLAAIIGVANVATLARHATQFDGLLRFPLHERMEMGRGCFDLSIHYHHGRTIVELEATWTEDHFELALTERGQRSLDLLGSNFEHADRWELAAKLVKSLSGLDRVMIYRFDEEANGQVIAEAREENLEPFLGLHYPASDIPPQARRLYESNLVRYLPDILYVPVPVLPPCSSDTAAPLDLGMANLRGISPVHIEYLRNMGVRGTLVLSLMANGRLWGLIACHHYRPLSLPFVTRRWLGHVAQMLGTWLGQAMYRDAAEERAQVGQLLERLHWAAADDGNATFIGLLERVGAQARAMLAADGIMVWSPDGVKVLAGDLPAAERERLLARLRREAGDTPVWVTDSYGVGEPGATALGGVLAVLFDDAGESGVVAWRAEQRREVRWAGDPGKAVTQSVGGMRLSPRRSFAEWSELVRGRSLPWSGECIRLAQGVANAFARFELRRQVLADLREARQRLVLLGSALSRSTEGVLVTDARLDGQGPRIVYANRGMCDLTGYEERELIGASPYMLHGRGTDVAALQALQEALARGETFRGEMLHYRKDGGELLVELSVDPLRDDAGEIVHFVALQRDIGERRRMEQELARLAVTLEERVATRTEELERTIHELEAFDFTIAHDLRSPLRTLLGFARMLRDADGPDNAAERRRFVDRIVANAESMNGLLDGLLAFARSSRAELVAGTVSADSLVADCVTQLRDRWPGTAFVVAPLPECRGDAKLIRQVWFNLLENAAKYSAKRPAPRVEVDFADGYYRVRDNGAGFDQKDADRVFGIFTRLHPRSEFEGTGIGMAIVKRIVERHNGAVTAEGRPGEGATFRFRIGP